MSQSFFGSPDFHLPYKKCSSSQRGEPIWGVCTYRCTHTFVYVRVSLSSILIILGFMQKPSGHGMPCLPLLPHLISPCGGVQSPPTCYRLAPMREQVPAWAQASKAEAQAPKEKGLLTGEEIVFLINTKEHKGKAEAASFDFVKINKLKILRKNLLLHESLKPGIHEEGWEVLIGNSGYLFPAKTESYSMNKHHTFFKTQVSDPPPPKCAGTVRWLLG